MQQSSCHWGRWVGSVTDGCSRWGPHAPSGRGSFGGLTSPFTPIRLNGVFLYATSKFHKCWYFEGGTSKVSRFKGSLVIQRRLSIWCTSPEGALLPDETGTIRIAVVVPPPYLQYSFRQSVQAVLEHSDGGCTISKLGMYRISGSGSGWPDIWPFLSIRFRLRFRPNGTKYQIFQPDSARSFSAVSSPS